MIKAIPTLAITCALFISSCYTNPVTGRKSLSLVNEGEMRQLAVSEYSTFLNTNKPIKGTPEAEMVTRVGSKLQVAIQKYLTSIGKQALLEGYQWEFNLVNGTEVNAWCMPGGKVVVYTGILPVVQNEAGLAVVLGHEIAHAIARHGSERMSQQLVAQAGGATLSALASSQPAQTQKIFNTAIGAGSTVAILAYSRAQESEADEMGLYTMAMAGYDPNEAVNFWQRMAVNSGQKQWEILSTHPADARRVQDIRGWLPRAMNYYNKR